MWFILAVYFDNIIPNASGLRKPLLYFLNNLYWMGKGGSKVKGKFLNLDIYIYIYMCACVCVCVAISSPS